MATQLNIISTDSVRQEARRRAEENSKRNDMKQHADKLIQGFQKLTDNHAKRAIWELFQNALDLAENAEIVINLTNTTLIFKHNGKPFDDNTLNCLIKQVSSKSAENNDDEIGQYGTGFITTHSFGRKIIISGSLRNENVFIPLNRFVLDRTAKTSPELIQELIKQQDAVFDLVENGAYQAQQTHFTDFEYVTESELQKHYAAEAMKSLPTILPYVMLLNKRLQKVTVIDADQNPVVYERGIRQPKGNLIESQIIVGGVPKTIYTIEDEHIVVILPLTNNNEAFIFDSQLSKLFLYYPLIGTESFGINFIIHSRNFVPTEQRDGIYLKSKTEQVQQDEKNNRNLIQKSSDMIFEFIQKNAATIGNPLNLAQINFNINNDKQPLLDEYFTQLKDHWIEKFKAFPLVETAGGNLKPENAIFFHDELLAPPETFDAIYALVNKYWKNIPQKDLVGRWTTIINEWGINVIKYVTIKDLVQEIHKAGNINNFNGDEENLKTFCNFLIKNGYGDYFNHYRLLPNIKGELRQLSALDNNINLPTILIEISDIIVPDISRRLINPEFKLSLELNPYSRKKFTSEFNNQVSILVKNHSLGKSIPPEYLSKLIDYCMLTMVDDSTSVPTRMMKLICRYYGHNEVPIRIEADKDDELDIRPPQGWLLRLFLNDISNEDIAWVTENLEFLHNVILTGISYSDFADSFKTASVFPNQLDELVDKSLLQVDDNIPEEIKDLFDKVVKPRLPIRACLVHDYFIDTLKEPLFKSTRSLTEQIESVFSSDGQYANINAHPFQEDIIDIIRKITEDTSWANHFPLLNSKRANVMLDKVSDNQITTDVFSIINLKPGQINALGNLARTGNIDQIIALGISAFTDNQKIESDFQFKYAIGKQIEYLITKRIGKDLETYSVKPLDEQNGQDIIIYRENEPIYFIEVKSRWNSDSSIMMSKNQFINAAKNKEKYALCSVDMTDYKIGQPERYTVDDVSIIFDRIRFVKTIGKELEPLVSGILFTTDIENEITLTGDYKATIPQTLIKNGINLEEFVKELIVELKLSQQS